jgi:hypothetical protein
LSRNVPFRRHCWKGRRKVFFLLSNVFRRRRWWISKFLHSFIISIWFFVTQRPVPETLLERKAQSFFSSQQRLPKETLMDREWGTGNDDLGHDGFWPLRHGGAKFFLSSHLSSIPELFLSLSGASVPNLLPKGSKHWSLQSLPVCTWFLVEQ